MRFGRQQWVENGTLGEAMATELCFILAGVTVGCLLFRLFSAFISHYLSVPSNPFFLLAIGSLFIPLPTVGIYAGQVVDRPLTLGYASLIQKAAFLFGVFVAGFVSKGTSWENLAVWSIVGAGIAILYSCSVLPRRAWYGFSPSRDMFMKMLRFSWAIPLGATALYVIQWVDSWVIRLYTDTKEVGLYNWAYQIISLGTMAFSTLAILVTPRMVDAGVSADRSEIENYSRNALRVLSLFSLGLLPVLPLMYPLMRLTVPSEYLGAYHALLILTAILPFLLMGYLVAPITNTFGKLVPRWAIISLIACLINALLDFIFVPLLGKPGAAVATGLALAFAGLGQTWTYSRYIGLKLLPISRITFLSLLPSVGSMAVLTLEDVWLSEGFCLVLGGVSVLLLKQVSARG
jgi:O-antigen/teichoic acid export membrane protein